MNLRQVRLQFRTVSGRHDLVNADGADNGADFYINAGIRHLDRRTRFQKSLARSFHLVAAGTVSVRFQLCRAVKEVWVATTSERWQLRKISWQEIRQHYLYQPTTSVGVLNCYAPTYLRPAPEVLTSEQVTALDWITQYMDDVVTDGTHALYNSLLLAAPPTEEMMVEVVGLFHSTELSAATDSNMWTALWPELVVQAACLELEKMHRNTQGLQDWNNALEMALTEIEKDGVEEDIAGGGQMEG